MTDNRFNKLKTVLEDIKISTDKPTAKKLALEKSNLVIQRLDSFSADCKGCNRSIVAKAILQVFFLLIY